MLLSEEQMIGFKAAASMLPPFPKAKASLADKGYDADPFRTTLGERGIAPRFT